MCLRKQSLNLQALAISLLNAFSRLYYVCPTDWKDQTVYYTFYECARCLISIFSNFTYKRDRVGKAIKLSHNQPSVLFKCIISYIFLCTLFGKFVSWLILCHVNQNVFIYLNLFGQDHGFKIHYSANHLCKSCVCSKCIF